VWDVTPAGLGGEGAYSIGGTPYLFTIDPEGEYVFGARSGDRAGAVMVDAESGSIVQDYPFVVSFPHAPLPNATFTRIFGSHSESRNGLILDAESGEILHQWKCLTPREVSPSGDVAVLDGQLRCDRDAGATFSRVIDLESGEVLLDLGERVIVNAMFSPLSTDDSVGLLVINARNSEIELYSLPDLEKIGELTAAEYGSAFFLRVHLDPESKYLGIGAGGGVVGVVDLQAVSNGESMFEALALHVEGHKTNVTQVTPTSSGLAVSAGFDGFYRVWDIESGERLFEIRVPDLRDPASAYWTNDGQVLGYEDASGYIRLTSVDVDEVLAQARAALTRSLTDDECRQYLHTDGCVD
jgi:WD40 repeat protein